MEPSWQAPSASPHISESGMSSQKTSLRSSWFSFGAAFALAACGETAISITNPETEPETEVDLERGLLAHFPFDEAEAGTEALDASGNGHHGTPSANPPTPSLSVPPVGFPNRHSLSFDGVDQLVDLGNPESLNVAGNATLSAWIRPLELDGFRNIVAHGFHWMPDGELALRIVDDDYEFMAWNGTDHMASAQVPPGDVDNWHHLAGVYDGETYRLYRDGELIVVHPDAFAPERVEAPWAIGGRSATMPLGDRPFAGLIDDVRIYGRALSDEEVRALFRR
jgi:hypothetical protein